MVEEERKFTVEPGWLMPDLSPAAPAGGSLRALPPATLVATYHDTVDLRLARAGVSLRHREGDELPWTVKLPTDSPGVRHEISRTGAPGAVPAELVELVTVFHRGGQLAPVAVVRTVRHGHEILDRAGTVLAEVVDDRVTVLDAEGASTRGFREVEAERKAGDIELLDRLTELLCDAGATHGGDFTPKHVRALGRPATAEPDLVAPTELPAEPSAAAVVTEAVRREVGRLLAHDPLVRLRAPVGDDDTAVHQMRVACRRLRSDLKTFGPLVRPAWARPLRGELKWLADSLGAARDTEVLRERLRRTATADPVSPVDPDAVERLDAVLAGWQDEALAEVDVALRSPRYLALVDALVLAARAPRLTPRAESPANRVLPRLVARPWRRLAGTAKKPGGVALLDPAGPDEQWHTVRKQGKQARSAVTAVAPVLGGDAAKLARALAKVQKLLGEHQDAAVAAQTWRAVAEARPADHRLAVAAGRLLERERAAVRRVRADFPYAWRRASRRRRTRWLA
ncbi:Inorganic triphosphatase YgiF, contains CYTH and CHAD domains [Micromonospora phaseoli]|uniref:Inorganic triphosphatase YgiF, contains CYTH and CHAD domains n=1 Tax=Micromonospora phaseoli TaxID=1144548 RepID=A0A1H6RAA0_9ACTN|nr:CYTH and CHAD domain-containing protein [Micromonospora phaseoli]PZW03392.1 inorganic triphosphatase YgiF [Micromonospora phaseoli]GIJ76957.1 CHAD domain-containing protein [Micromonospora phaseoli]SEI52778.1 Inorganic triphosphatase YgiF, contains CYTH and CHAD domains [Micromonospora phaseoli]